MRELVISKKALKQVKSLPNDHQGFLLKELVKLKNGESNIDIKKIKSKKNIFRLRKGDYRVFYTIENNQIIVLGLEIRKDAY